MSRLRSTIRFCYCPGAGELYPGVPAYATAGSAGIDLRACLPDTDAVCIAPGERKAIPTGLRLELPGIAADGSCLAAFVYSRSGLGAVQGLTVAQGVGVIDPDYRGEIVVILLNTSSTEKMVQRGDRIAQLVFQHVVRVCLEEATALDATGRGSGGFGHTGR